MDELLQYLKQQEIFQIAPKSEDPWIANIYTACESPERLYFMTSQQLRFAEMIQKEGRVAFATASCPQEDHTDRKGVQGVGYCKPLTDEVEIKRAVDLHNKKYPEFKEDITFKNLEENLSDTRAWVLIPEHIKFWNDELYKNESFKEFEF